RAEGSGGLETEAETASGTSRIATLQRLDDDPVLLGEPLSQAEVEGADGVGVGLGCGHEGATLQRELRPALAPDEDGCEAALGQRVLEPIDRVLPVAGIGAPSGPAADLDGRVTAPEHVHEYEAETLVGTAGAPVGDRIRMGLEQLTRPTGALRRCLGADHEARPLQLGEMLANGVVVEVQQLRQMADGDRL